VDAHAQSISSNSQSSPARCAAKATAAVTCACKNRFVYRSHPVEYTGYTTALSSSVTAAVLSRFESSSLVDVGFASLPPRRQQQLWRTTRAVATSQGSSAESPFCSHLCSNVLQLSPKDSANDQQAIAAVTTTTTSPTDTWLEIVPLLARRRRPCARTITFPNISTLANGRLTNGWD
jgi:hypothetical protein